MFKKNKKNIENCVKCGKPLSKREKESGIKKCENCIGKSSSKTKGIMSVVGTAVVSAIIYVALRKKQ